MPPGIVGLIIGGSSDLTLKGIIINLGVIDLDSSGEIIVVLTVQVTRTFKG